MDDQTEADAHCICTVCTAKHFHKMNH